MKRSNVARYRVSLKYDPRDGKVGELIDSFQHPKNHKTMFSLLFPDGELAGYFIDELEPVVKVIK